MAKAGSSRDTTPSAPSPERQDPTPDVRVVLRPLATPLSLGFLGLAAATLTLSGLQLEWFAPTRNWTTVGLLVIVLPVPLQFLGAIMGFLTRDAIAATGLGLLSGAWLAVGAATFTGGPGQLSPALGLALIGVATGLLVPAAAGWRSKAVASVVMGIAALRFGLTGAEELSGSAGWRLAAGGCGLLLFAVAVYAALAFELESVRRRTVLPTGRRGRGAIAIGGTFEQEIAGIHHEPGVRQEL